MDKPIRIAHILSDMGFGGAEAVAMNYFRHIDTKKIKFDFIAHEGSGLPHKDEIESLGGKIIIIPPYKTIAKYLKELKRVFKENNYDIVHSHINTLSVFPLYIAKKCGIQTRIAHNHSTAGRGEWKRNIMKYILRPFSRVFSTDYYACTEYAGNWLFGKKHFKKKGVVINNAIDVEKFRFDANVRKELREELGIKNKFVIGHIGRFVTVKNQGFIMDVFYEIQKEKEDSVLLFVGDGPMLEEIKYKAKELKLEDKVIYLPSRTDINKTYQAFDLFLFPSLYEGLGMVLIEAQIAGLPCIVSDVVPIDAKICNLVTFLSLNEEASCWAKKCLELHNVKRKSHIDEAQKHGFDIVKEAKKLEERYIKFGRVRAPDRSLGHVHKK